MLLTDSSVLVIFSCTYSLTPLMTLLCSFCLLVLSFPLNASHECVSPGDKSTVLLVELLFRLSMNNLGSMFDPELLNWYFFSTCKCHLLYITLAFFFSTLWSELPVLTVSFLSIPSLSVFAGYERSIHSFSDCSISWLDSS